MKNITLKPKYETWEERLRKKRKVTLESNLVKKEKVVIPSLKPKFGIEQKKTVEPLSMPVFNIKNRKIEKIPIPRGLEPKDETRKEVPGALRINVKRYAKTPKEPYSGYTLDLGQDKFDEDKINKIIEQKYTESEGSINPILTPLYDTERKSRLFAFRGQLLPMKEAYDAAKHLRESKVTQPAPEPYKATKEDLIREGLLKGKKWREEEGKKEIQVTDIEKDIPETGLSQTELGKELILHPEIKGSKIAITDWADEKLSNYIKSPTKENANKLIEAEKLYLRAAQMKIPNYKVEFAKSLLIKQPLSFLKKAWDLSVLPFEATERLLYATAEALVRGERTSLKTFIKDFKSEKAEGTYERASEPILKVLYAMHVQGIKKAQWPGYNTMDRLKTIYNSDEAAKWAADPRVSKMGDLAFHMTLNPYLLFNLPAVGKLAKLIKTPITKLGTKIIKAEKAARAGKPFPPVVTKVAEFFKRVPDESAIASRTLPTRIFYKTKQILNKKIEIGTRAGRKTLKELIPKRLNEKTQGEVIAILRRKELIDLKTGKVIEADVIALRKQGWSNESIEVAKKIRKFFQSSYKKEAIAYRKLNNKTAPYQENYWPSTHEAKLSLGGELKEPKARFAWFYKRGKVPQDFDGGLEYVATRLVKELARYDKSKEGAKLLNEIIKNKNKAVADGLTAETKRWISAENYLKSELIPGAKKVYPVALPPTKLKSVLTFVPKTIRRIENTLLLEWNPAWVAIHATDTMGRTVLMKVPMRKFWRYSKGWVDPITKEVHTWGMAETDIAKALIDTGIKPGAKGMKLFTNAVNWIENTLRNLTWKTFFDRAYARNIKQGMKPLLAHSEALEWARRATGARHVVYRAKSPADNYARILFPWWQFASGNPKAWALIAKDAPWLPGMTGLIYKNAQEVAKKSFKTYKGVKVGNYVMDPSQFLSLKRFTQPSQLLTDRKFEDQTLFAQSYLVAKMSGFNLDPFVGMLLSRFKKIPSEDWKRRFPQLSLVEDAITSSAGKPFRFADFALENLRVPEKDSEWFTTHRAGKDRFNYLVDKQMRVAKFNGKSLTEVQAKKQVANDLLLSGIMGFFFHAYGKVYRSDEQKFDIYREKYYRAGKPLAEKVPKPSENLKKVISERAGISDAEATVIAEMDLSYRGKKGATQKRMGKIHPEIFPEERKGDTPEVATARKKVSIEIKRLGKNPNYRSKIITAVKQTGAFGPKTDSDEAFKIYDDSVDKFQKERVTNKEIGHYGVSNWAWKELPERYKNAIRNSKDANTRDWANENDRKITEKTRWTWEENTRAEYRELTDKNASPDEIRKALGEEKLTYMVMPYSKKGAGKNFEGYSKIWYSKDFGNREDEIRKRGWSDKFFTARGNPENFTVEQITEIGKNFITDWNDWEKIQLTKPDKKERSHLKKVDNPEIAVKEILAKKEDKATTDSANKYWEGTKKLTRARTLEELDKIYKTISPMDEAAAKRYRPESYESSTTIYKERQASMWYDIWEKKGFPLDIYEKEIFPRKEAIWSARIVDVVNTQQKKIEDAYKGKVHNYREALKKFSETGDSTEVKKFEFTPEEIKIGIEAPQTSKLHFNYEQETHDAEEKSVRVKASIKYGLFTKAIKEKDFVKAGEFLTSMTEGEKTLWEKEHPATKLDEYLKSSIESFVKVSQQKVITSYYDIQNAYIKNPTEENYDKLKENWVLCTDKVKEQYYEGTGRKLRSPEEIKSSLRKLSHKLGYAGNVRSMISSLPRQDYVNRFSSLSSYITNYQKVNKVYPSVTKIIRSYPELTKIFKTYPTLANIRNIARDYSSATYIRVIRRWLKNPDVYKLWALPRPVLQRFWKTNKSLVMFNWNYGSPYWKNRLVRNVEDQLKRLLAKKK